MHISCRSAQNFELSVSKGRVFFVWQLELFFVYRCDTFKKKKVSTGEVTVKSAKYILVPVPCMSPLFQCTTSKAYLGLSLLPGEELHSVLLYTSHSNWSLQQVVLFEVGEKHEFIVKCQTELQLKQCRRSWSLVQMIVFLYTKGVILFRSCLGYRCFWPKVPSL